MKISNFKSFKIDVNSSLVEYLEYDLRKFRMKVRFKPGKSRKRKYCLNEVTPDQFNDILNADSIGKAVLKVKKTSV